MVQQHPEHDTVPVPIDDGKVRAAPLPTPTEALHQYVQAATAENTRKAYRSAIKQFERWGGRLPTDQDTLVRYLVARAETLNPRTLALHLTAIRQWHHRTPAHAKQ